MLNLNRHEVIGHLGADPQLRETSVGTRANMSVATTATWKDAAGTKRQATEWHRVVVWGERAKMLAEYLHRGSYVRIVGRSKTRGWTDSDGIKRYSTELVAERVDFLTPRQTAESVLPPAPDLPEAPADQADDQHQPPPAAGDDDIPF